MIEFNQITLGDYIETLTDYHANGSYKILKENIDLKKVPDYAIMIRTLNFERSDFKRDLIYLNEREYNYLKKTKVYPNDILMNKIANPGSVYLMPDLNVPVSLAMNLFLIRFNNEINQVFMFYLMKANENYIKQFANGTTTLTITKDAVKSLCFKVPSKFYQNQIAKILSDLDAKIELNNKINHELEAMAKLIYDYWFVQFDFPDVNGNPYKSSGGKMIYNETLKQDIPADWAVKTLNEITKISKKTISPAEFSDTKFRYYSIPTFDEIGTFSFEYGAEIGSNKFTVSENDILISKLNPWFNRVIYSLKEDLQICSTEFVVWSCGSREVKNFLYQLARNQSFVSYCTQCATGTSNSHKRVNPSVMMQFKIPYKKEIVMSYGEKINSIIKKIILNKQENITLSNLRDWLLPMLMNGQVIFQSL